MTPQNEDFEEPKTEPIQTDQLDLHTFQPAECADVVAEFVGAARQEGYRMVRIIHGKGTGTLRRIVHSVLENHPAVARFTLGDETSGSWGATLVELKTEVES
jgi:DNA-nicking Smr family endonuclease